MNRRELLKSGLAALASVPLVGWVPKAFGRTALIAEPAVWFPVWEEFNLGFTDFCDIKLLHCEGDRIFGQYGDRPMQAHIRNNYTILSYQGEAPPVRASVCCRAYRKDGESVLNIDYIEMWRSI